MTNLECRQTNKFPVIPILKSNGRIRNGSMCFPWWLNTTLVTMRDMPSLISAWIVPPGDRSMTIYLTGKWYHVHIFVEIDI